MSVKFFQREIWAHDVQEDLELEGKLVRHCTRKYEGDAEYAKTVRILGVGDPLIDSYTGTVEYEDMDDVGQNLDIDIREYFSFKVDDVDKAQSMPGLDSAYKKKAVKRLAQRREINVGRLVAGRCLSTENEARATKVKTTDVTPVPYKDYYYETTNSAGETVFKRVKKVKPENMSEYYEIDIIANAELYKEGAINITPATGKTQSAIKTAIDTALTNLRLRNNSEDGFLEIDPVTYMNFKNNLIELDTNNPELIRRGVVGYYDSYEVTRTNAIYKDEKYHCFAHSGQAIAFVGQINEVEALRLEGTFGDGIRGLDTFGLKIIDQDQIEAIEIPA